MAPKKSLLEHMQDNPKGDWTIDDVKALCVQYGWSCQRPPNGSHYRLASPDGSTKLTVPYRRPIKPFYIRALTHAIEEGWGDD